MRWFQFSLRAIFFSVLVVAIVCVFWRTQYAIVTKTCSISDLLSHPDQSSWLEDTITSEISPTDWDNVGGIGFCGVDSDAKTLEISHRGPIHRQVTELLNQLRQQGSEHLYQQWVADTFRPPFDGDCHGTRWPPPAKIWP